MIRGTYLTLQVEEELIAEAVDVSLKVKAKKLDTTSQDDGLTASFMQGNVKINMGGKFLLATSGANFTKLYDYLRTTQEVRLSLYRDTVEVLGGYGLVKRLRKGTRHDELITGSFGLRFYVDRVGTGGETILSEAGLTITTEAGETIITD